MINRIFSKWVYITVAVVFVLELSGNPAWAADSEYAIGADLSFLKSAEDRGVGFKDGGAVKPGLEIFRDHGFNWVRLRLFHSPDRLPNDLEYTISLAKAAKQLGYKFLLNYHYSDTWADPQQQFIPAAWEGQSHGELVDSVRAYTRETMQAFREAGAWPDMVQPGNEVIDGMMWPDGQLSQEGGWDRFADLVRAAIEGVEAATTDDVEPPLIMIHIDRGGDMERTKWFFDKFHSYGIDYDVIGQSYYPWWHGTLAELRANFAFMVEAYDKDIVLVEAAYHWRESGEWEDAARADAMEYPQTPEGQMRYWLDVDAAVRAIPGGRGKGVMWWEPAVGNRRGIGSRGMFDEDGNALPAVGAIQTRQREAAPR
ncbi:MULTISPECIES: glycosyl hydrolase 53 family protein [unclassified Microbulbifer]|uniref:glycoside hydrolase family 53 protein n=1 Tax=unclassified Microbulbifer TaxID=2619833 RepID=UPI0027E543DA|nr:MULTISPECIES: glycosyl hydrolase 53 family protein [unclassified Microbulbifer]